jgi:hypothetical protein
MITLWLIVMINMFYDSVGGFFCEKLVLRAEKKNKLKYFLTGL